LPRHFPPPAAGSLAEFNVKLNWAVEDSQRSAESSVEQMRPLCAENAMVVKVGIES